MTRTQSRRQSQALSCPAPALLGVGALLLCASPTGAQNIFVTGGTATVSGAGTAVTAGTFVTFGGGAGPGTSSYQTGTAMGGPGGGTLNLQDGGSFQSITVNFFGTANVSGGTAGTVGDLPGFSAIGDVINISGGTVTTVFNDRGSVSITGGTIQNVNGSAPNQTGPISISGGNIQNVNTPDGLGVSGGILGSVSDGSSSLFGGVGISGGTIQTLTIQGSSGTISGGSISTLSNGSPNTQISGGGFQFITNAGIINILGTGLQEIGNPTDANDDGVFQLTGLLSDGEVLNTQYKQTSGSLDFNGVKATPTPVPEASTAISLGGVLLLGGAGLAFCARRRVRA